jgi:hypothetical protein
MALTPQLALLCVITTGVGIVMLLHGLEEGKVRLRLRSMRRCAACGRFRRSSERCPCLDA